jgi:pimeloyl-ACP methyl ester carboxylesterase
VHETPGVVSGLHVPGLGDRQCWADIWVRSGWRVREHVWSQQAQLLDPGDEVVISGSVGECLDRAQNDAPHAAGRRAAILMHGLGRSRRSMRHIAAGLQAQGWSVANIDYPSLFRTVEAHAEQVRGVAHALTADGAETVVFAGHSLGGLIGRLAMARDWPGRRAVFIGAPNRGALVADWLSHLPGYNLVTGACGQLITHAGAAHIPVPAVEIGVIAGGTGGWGFNPWLGEDNDGLVRVTETRLDGAETDFRLVHSFHGVMPKNREVIAATITFLAEGRLGA